MPFEYKPMSETAAEYAMGALRGLGKAAVGLGTAIWETALDPYDNLIEPIALPIYHASMISAMHAPDDDIAQMALKFHVQNNPHLYKDAVEYFENMANTVERAAQNLAAAPGPKKVEVGAELLAGVFAPGFIAKAAIAARQAATNRQVFGTFSRPPRFDNTMANNDGKTVAKTFHPHTVEDVKATWGERNYLYVITEDNQLVISTRQQPIFEDVTHGNPKFETGYLHHHYLAKLQPVVAAGEFRTFNGNLMSINNKSGHFRPFGDHLPAFVEGAFGKFGFEAVEGKFSFFTNLNTDGRFPKPTYFRFDLAPGKELLLTTWLSASGTRKDLLSAIPTVDTESDQDIPALVDDDNAVAKSTRANRVAGAQTSSETDDAIVVSDQYQANLETIENAAAHAAKQARDYQFAVDAQRANDVFEQFGRLNLQEVGVVGKNYVQAMTSLKELSADFPFIEGVIGAGSLLGTTMSALSLVQPYVALGSAAIQIGMILFGKRKEDEQAKRIAAQLQLIAQSIAVARQEMHKRFDGVDEKLGYMINQLAAVEYALKDVLQINHSTELRNINYGTDAVSEDVRHAHDVEMALMTNFHLDELDKLLIHIDGHHQGRLVGEEKDRLADLITASTELDGIWISKNLLGSNYNGEIYSTDSMRQDRQFVGKGVPYVGSALGFLHHFAVAEDRLNLGKELQDINAEQLPHVDLWAHAVQAGLVARVCAAKAYHHEMGVGKIAELKQVAANTVKFVDKLAEHAKPLFGQLVAKRSQALQDLKSILIQKVAAALKGADASYSVKGLMEAGLLQLPPMKDVDHRFIGKIADHGAANHLNVPLVLLLALKLELVNLDSHSRLNRQPGDAWNSNTLADWNRHFELGIRSLGADFSLQIHLAMEGKQLPMMTVGSRKESTFKASYYRKGWSYDSEEAKAKAACEIENQTADPELIAQTNIVDIQVNKDLKLAIEMLLLDKIATLLVEKMQAGESLAALLGESIANDWLSVYRAAVDATLQDRARTGETVDTIQVMQGMAVSYAKLIGLPQAAQDTLKMQLIADSTQILLTPTCFAAVNSTANAVWQTVNDAMPGRQSSVVQKMNGVHRALVEFESSYNLQGYRDRVAQWQKEVKRLSISQRKYAQMQRIHQQDNRLVKASEIRQLEQGNAQKADALKQQHLDLANAYDRLKNAGFDPEKPADLAEVLCKATSNPETLTPIVFTTREKWQTEASELGFSPMVAASLLETAVQQMQPQQENMRSSIWRMGITGVGKSTLTNYLHGTDYQSSFDENGKSIVSPANSVAEISPTGSKRSVTILPTPYTFGNKVHIDLPGAQDTQGVEMDMHAATATLMMASKQKVTNVIEIVCPDSDIFHVRSQGMREIFRKVGRLVQTDPAGLAPHLLITVTKPDHARLARAAKGDVKTYEWMVLRLLKDWYESDIAKKPHGDRDYPIRFVLQNLTANNIIMVDVLQPDARQRYLQRIDSVPLIKTTAINFSGDESLLPFYRFVQSLSRYQQRLQTDIATTMGVLRRHWQQTARGSQDSDAMVSELVMMLAEGMRLHPLLEQLQALTSFDAPSLYPVPSLDGLGLCGLPLPLVAKSLPMSPAGFVRLDAGQSAAYPLVEPTLPSVDGTIALAAVGANLLGKAFRAIMGTRQSPVSAPMFAEFSKQKVCLESSKTPDVGNPLRLGK